ncbi:MAG: hypothetical protein ACT4OX_04960 [Actinomycetota bacterium]
MAASLISLIGAPIGVLIGVIVMTAAFAIVAAARRVQAEMTPTEEHLRAFGAHVRPALLRVRRETAATRARLER